MQNILLLFARYGSHILFVGLEILCFYLVINYNRTQNDIFLNSTSLFSGKLDNQVDNARDFFYLDEINDSLQKENSIMLEALINSNINIPYIANQDSSLKKYKIIPATICGSSIHKRNNTFSLCQGKKDGILPDMGVITRNGVIGTIRHASNHYATIIPLTNGLSRTSCMIKSKNFAGILSWQDKNPRKMTLEDIPKHANITIGDTVMTSGFSSVFPKGIEIGVISNFTIDKGSATYIIDVELWEDLSRIEYVYVIDHLYKQEIDSLLNLTVNE